MEYWWYCGIILNTSGIIRESAPSWTEITPVSEDSWLTNSSWGSFWSWSLSYSPLSSLLITVHPPFFFSFSDSSCPEGRGGFLRLWDFSRYPDISLLRSFAFIWASSASSSFVLRFHSSLLFSKKRILFLSCLINLLASRHFNFHWSRLFSKNLISFLGGLLYSLPCCISLIASTFSLFTSLYHPCWWGI